MDRLPDELILLIATFLDPLDIVRVQVVSKRLGTLARDTNLWKAICFNNSRAEALRRRQELMATQEPRLVTLREALDALADSPLRPPTAGTDVHETNTSEGQTAQYRRGTDARKRAMANWDPGYEGERIDFYQEYVHRHAPIAMSWLQPALDGIGDGREEREVTGVGTITAGEEKAVDKVIGALDDGSICLWDMASPLLSVKGGGSQGSIFVRSTPYLLYGGSPSTDAKTNLARSRAVMTETGAVECVSIDSAQNKGYFAVKNTLNEVDLRTFQVASRTRFPFLITALSEARHPTPITVGTNLTLHLHDPRAPCHSSETEFPSSSSSDLSTRCELIAGPCPQSPFARLTPTTRPPGSTSSDFSRLLTGDPLSSYTTFSPSSPSSAGSHTHAPLSQPGPLSILHLTPPSNPSDWDGNGDIWVAGRFTSLLNYSRRFFPRLRGTIHSGARLSSLTSLPFPYLNPEPSSTFSTSQIRTIKSTPGRTLLAGGEYKGKGSLEMYGLSSDPTYATLSTDPVSARRTVYQNRQTASRSKVLSVAAHGARIVFSDGDGGLKWVERDGRSVVREWNVNDALVADGGLGAAAASSMVGRDGERDARNEVTRGGLFGGEEKGDIIQKIIPTHGSSYPPPSSSSRSSSGPPRPSTNQDNLLLWTGEGRLGMLGFSPRPAFESFQDGDEEDGIRGSGDAGKEGTKREERAYVGAMRRALERMGDEARFMRGLGFGFGFGGFGGAK